MSGDKVHQSPTDFDFRANKPASFRFAQVLKVTMLGGQDRPSRKNRDTVLASLERKIECEGELHTRQAREFRDLVNPAGPFYAAVDFLQPDQIRMLSFNHCGNARQIKL